MVVFAKNFVKNQRFFWTQFFGVLGLLSAIVTILVATPMFHDVLNANALKFYGLVLVLAMLWACWTLHTATSSAEFSIRGSELDIAIIFDNIFLQEGSIMIPVSPRFRHRLKSTAGGRVDAQSVHGQLITMLGGEDGFRDKVAVALEGITPINGGTVAEETAEFPLGTVASIERPDLKEGQQGFFHLVAITEENAQSGETSSTLPILVTAICDALKHISLTDHADDIAMPLIGARFGRIRLGKQNLLDVLIATVSEYFSRSARRQKVTFVLDKALRSKLKLYNIQREWS